MDKLRAKIHSYESLATLDGEGVRYGVFFTGCPLRCCYCHNPDTWTHYGYEVTVEELLAKIKRYKPYFKQNGGVTFSGGEPLLHSEFLAELAPLLAKEGINYTIDTCGNVELTESVCQAVVGAELVILDIKYTNSEDYKRYANGDFDKIISFGDYLNSINKKTWIRTVIVPNQNDKKVDIKGYMDIISKWKNVTKYELLPFHTMGFEKYERLNIPNRLIGVKALDTDIIAQLMNGGTEFPNI